MIGNHIFQILRNLNRPLLIKKPKKNLKTPIIFDLTLIIPLICLEHLFWLNIEMVYDSWKLSRENLFVFYIHQLLQDYFCCNVYQ